MKTVGLFTSLIGGAVAALLVVVGVRSIPDIKRYFKIRGM
jgi:Family of unknown function (DUF6893)